MAVYTSIDHTESIRGHRPWVQATPLEETCLPAPGKHTATVILLHGFGNSGAAWEPIARHLQESLPHVKFILPNASIKPVHVPIAGAPGETELPAWWDPNLSPGLPTVWAGRDTPLEDREGFADASARTKKIIEEEAKLVAPGRLFLGGFSQGTILSLAVGLENDKVGGIIALSSYLSVPDSFESIGAPDPSILKKPIFWAHGTADPFPISWGYKSIDYLVNTMGFKKVSKNDTPTAGTITWVTYDGLKHETSIEELEDIQKWLSVTLA